jgi:hypothetical protein
MPAAAVVAGPGDGEVAGITSSRQATCWPMQAGVTK